MIRMKAAQEGVDMKVGHASVMRHCEP